MAAVKPGVFRSVSLPFQQTSILVRNFFDSKAFLNKITGAPAIKLFQKYTDEIPQSLIKV